MSERGKNGARHSAFLPLLLLASGLVVMTGFQTMQLSREADLLEQRHAQQEGPLKEATTVRTQLEAVAKGTALLARDGNSNAVQLLEQLRRAGITVNPDAPPTE